MAVITEAKFRLVGAAGGTTPYSPSRNPDMNVEEKTNYKGISINQSYGGKIYTNQRYGKQLEYKLTYTNLSETDKGKLIALLDAVDGRKDAFQFTPNNSTYYTVRFTEDNLSFVQTSYGIYSVSFSILQEV